MRRIAPARAADLFTAVVVASVAIALAGLTWDLVVVAQTRPPVVPPPALPRTAVDIGPVVALAPFGGAAVGPAGQTSLPLVLRGVIVATPAPLSTAFVAASGAPPLIYHPGDPVPGGASLVEVGVDHIILLVGGRRERLGFPLPPAAGAAPPGSPPGGMMANAPASASPIASEMALGASPSRAPPPPQNPAGLLDSMGATPVPGGYRVGEGMSPNFRQAGLQPGDVLEALNGATLGNPAADAQVVQTAMRSGSVSLTVQRAGRRLIMSFPLR